MTIAVGDKLPDAIFRTRTSDGVEEITTETLTKGKKVLIFAVPGAFTPTCHARHLPSYLNKADELKSKGIDTIACVAVNDVFVLDAWAKQQSAGSKVLMLSDGNASFTKAVGLDFDGTGFGLGMRSKRYAMLVVDGIVEMLNIEDAPGVMEVSGAETILEAL